MDRDRAFILGIILGIAGSMVPSAVEAYEIKNEKPEYLPVAIASYGVLLALTMWIFYEMST